MKDIFKKILGIPTLEEKAEEYIQLENEKELLKGDIDNAAEEFQYMSYVRKSGIEKCNNEEIKERIEDKYNDFIAEHLSNVKKLRERKKEIDLRLQKLNKDERIKKGIGELKKINAYNTLKKAYKLGRLSHSAFDKICKAKQGKVKFADVLVYDKDLNQLYLKRKSDSTFEPEKWGLPGGHVDLHEDCKEAAIRELQEETGIDVKSKDLELIGKYDKGGVYIEYYKVYLKEEKPQITLESSEHQDYKWGRFDDFTKEEMLLNLHSNLEDILNPLKRNISIIKKAIDQGLISKDQLIDIVKAKKDPCWEGYEQYGTKKKDGKEVPNCVKKADEDWDSWEEMEKSEDEETPSNGTIKPSTRDGKKAMVWMDGKWHHFGQKGAKHNYSKEAREAAKARHKKNLEGSDPRSKAFRVYWKKYWEKGGKVKETDTTKAEADYFNIIDEDDDIFKSWSSDLKNRFPNGDWRTINGAKVFINNGRVIAGLDGFNGMIDNYFKENKESKIKISKETDKAYLLNKDGVEFWVQKRWYNKDKEKLTPRGEKALNEVLEKQSKVEGGNKDFDIKKETQKAFLLEKNGVEFWVPKSWYKDGSLNSKGLDNYLDAKEKQRPYKIWEAPGGDMFRAYDKDGSGNYIQISVKERNPQGYYERHRYSKGESGFYTFFIKENGDFSQADKKQFIEDIEDKFGAYHVNYVEKSSIDTLIKALESNKLDWNSFEKAGGHKYIRREGTPGNYKYIYKESKTKGKKDDIITPEERAKNFKEWFGDSKVVDENGKPLVVYHGTASDKKFTEFKPMSSSEARHIHFNDNFTFFTSKKDIAEDYSNSSELIMFMQEYGLEEDDYDLFFVPQSVREENKDKFENYLKNSHGLSESEIDELDDLDLNNYWQDYFTDLLAYYDKKHIYSTYLKIEKPKIVNAEKLLNSLSEEEKDTIRNEHETLREYIISSFEREYKDKGYDGLIIKNIFDSPKYGEVIDDEGKEMKSDIYITVSPNQIKSATENKGTFDPNSNDITKSSVDTLLKAFESGILDYDLFEKAGGHKYIRREGTKGNYKYIYAEPHGTDGGHKEEMEGLGQLNEKDFLNRLGEALYSYNKEPKKIRDLRKDIINYLYINSEESILTNNDYFNDYVQEWIEKNKPVHLDNDDFVNDYIHIETGEKENATKLIEEYKEYIDSLEENMDTDEEEEGDQEEIERYEEEIKTIVKNSITRSDLHEILSDLNELKSKFYEDKNKIIEKYGEFTGIVHSFKGDEDNLYPLYKIGGNEFHLIKDKEDIDEKYKEDIVELDEIRRESKRELTQEDIKILNYALDNKKIIKSRYFDPNSNDITKAGGHKYIRREGTPGNYKYIYNEQSNNQKERKEKGSDKVKSSYGFDYVSEGKGKNGAVFKVKNSEGEEVALLEYHNINDNKVEVDRIYVRDKFQKKGNGQKILKDILDHEKADSFELYPLDHVPWVKMGMQFEGKMLKISKEDFVDKNKKKLETAKSQDEDIQKAEYTKDQLQSMVEEHERLISIIEPHAKMDEKVAKEVEIQKKELEDYKKQLSELIGKADGDELNPFEEFEYIEKAQRVYADNALNRKLKRVGKPYGSTGQEETPKDKPSKESDESKQSSKSVEDHAKQASGEALEEASKNAKDPEMREAAHKELQRREKEEKPKEEKVQEEGLDQSKEKEGNSQKEEGKEGDSPKEGSFLDKYKDKIKNWTQKEKEFFRKGLHKEGSRERRKFGDFIKDKSKGIIKAVKHEVEEFKEAGHGIAKLFQGKKIEDKEKEAVKNVSKHLALTIGSIVATGGAGHLLHAGIMGASKGLFVHYLEHVGVQTLGRALIFASDEGNIGEVRDVDPEKVIEQLLLDFSNWVKNEEISEEKWVDIMNDSKELLEQEKYNKSEKESNNKRDE
jgi:8-oxo-dGTP pyrophosphatase MutT (NUDIX family)/predicted GNAT family acetyltransferase